MINLFYLSIVWVDNYLTLKNLSTNAWMNQFHIFLFVFCFGDYSSAIIFYSNYASNLSIMLINSEVY